jgi:FMN phosphatase YigB (HAD superfamily)
MNLCFDAGQVFVRFDFSSFLQDVAKAFYEKDYSEENKNELFSYMKSIQGPSYLGHDTIEGLFSFGYYSVPMKDAQKRKILNESWAKTIRPVRPILDYIYSLHKKGHAISILSNIGTDHKNLLLKEIPELNEYHLHLSCDVGAMKPHKIYYQSFLQDSFDKKCLFIKPFFFFDDRQENLDAAKNTDKDLFKTYKFDLSDYPKDEDAANAFIELVDGVIDSNRFRYINI